MLYWKKIVEYDVVVQVGAQAPQAVTAYPAETQIMFWLGVRLPEERK